MNVAFRRSFERDVRKVREKRTLDKIRYAIENVENAVDLESVPNLKKLQGFEGCYRIRLGDYRIGLFVDAETVEFVRILHRKDIYRHFP